MKIAICLSGETRDWDDYSSKNLAHFISNLEANGHEVDCFGHTWSHCKPPSQKSVKLKKSIIENQKVIEDWVMGDWEKRLTFNNEICEDMEYNPMDHHGYDHSKIQYKNVSDEMVEKILDYCCRGYGQHISGWKSFQLADEGYDLYVRWRWDLIFCKDDESNHMSDYKKVIDFWQPFIEVAFKALSTTSFSDAQDIGVAFTGNAIVKKANHACIDDLFMIFTPKVKSIIDTIDIYDAIDLRFLDTGNDNMEYNKALYHDLWTWTLTELIGVEGVCNLPACINPSFREDRFN